jgi:hypothetical protein
MDILGLSGSELNKQRKDNVAYIETQAALIREQHKNGATMVSLVKQYNTSDLVIRDIIRRNRGVGMINRYKSWAEFTEEERQFLKPTKTN